jgi:trans-2,3-dihydro-3-hydroxyanthranilate isomerase
MRRRFYCLDVFTSKPYTGNPLAVVTDGDGLRADKMLAIAREMNLSETVFVQRPTTNRALARLRIFTTLGELPLAGHPVIGTWFLLAALGVVPAQEGSVRVQQQTGAGVLPVEITFRNGRPVRVTMVQKPADFRPARIRAAALAAALGIAAADLDPALPLECVSTGIFNLMVPVRRRAVLRRIHHHPRALAHLLAKRAVMAYCFALAGRAKVFARGMLPWALAEDPATGSAAGSLAAYLVAHGRLSPGAPLEIIQGVEMGRPSVIGVVVRRQDTRLIPLVSGTAVPVSEGFLEA